MKLFVWDDTWPEVGDTSIAFALAEDVEQARQLIMAGYCEEYMSKHLTEAEKVSRLEPIKKELEGEPKVYTEPFGCYFWGYD